MNPADPTLDEDSAPSAVDAAIASLPPSSEAKAGRGIVVPGGGAKYFPGAWACIRTLRDLGCGLPIELWHVGEEEVNDEMRHLVKPFGVRCVDAGHVQLRHPARFLKGWPLKPYAMLHSGFREVLLLDADNIPVVDPTYLFDQLQYLRHGAVFWPDISTIAPHRKIWALTGVHYRREPAVESAQILVDTGRCWRPLALTVWMNCQHADFWYRHIYGDKDTFHFAWRKLGMEYAMPGPAARLPMTLVHHDFQGRAIFQHRHWNKWSLDGQMLRIPGFRHEDRCLEHLAELRELWSGAPTRRYDEVRSDSDTRAIARHLVESNWSLRADSKSSEVRFGRDGRLAGGNTRERYWSLRVDPFELVLSIIGIESLAWLLVRDCRDRWVGRAPLEAGRRVELVRAA
jgi:hypothetical protein